MRRAALFALATGLALSVVPAVAEAQSAPQPAAAPTTTAAPKAAPKAEPKTAEPAKTADWTGTWSGSVVQVGRVKPFALSVTLAGKTGKTSYPDDRCTGKLVRVGTAGNYAFFTETITEGKLDPATMKGCVDGSLTIAKDVSGLVMSWMATYNGKAIVAYGTLAPTK